MKQTLLHRKETKLILRTIAQRPNSFFVNLDILLDENLFISVPAKFLIKSLYRFLLAGPQYEVLRGMEKKQYCSNFSRSHPVNHPIQQKK